jgi:hypothetical protein
VSSEIITEKLLGASGKDRTIATFKYAHLEPDEVQNKFTKHNHKDSIRGSLDMVLKLTTLDEGVTTQLSMDLDMKMYPDGQQSSYVSPTQISVPRMMMDKMVMRWGEVSLHKLVKTCKTNLGLETELDKKNFLWNFIPIKR